MSNVVNLFERYDQPDIKGQHRLIVFRPLAGDRRYLPDPYDGEARCGKCHRHGITLSLLPRCTSGPFETGEEL
jgi:hypothetical protein